MKKLNIDKYITYRYSFAKLKKAITNEFYFEAILIEYAIIEDRINSIFRRIGFLNESGNLPEGKSKILKRIFQTQTLRWTDISIKLKFVNALITSESINIPNQEDKLYISELSITIKPISGELTELISQLKPWLTKRNKYVHALMEYKTTTIEEELKAFVNDGEIMIRKLDFLVKKI